MDADCAAVILNGKITSFVPAFTQDTLEKLTAAAKNAQQPTL